MNDNFDNRLPPNNVVEYMLFIPHHSSATPLLTQLHDVRKQALELVDQVAKRHIWQREQFTLDVVSRSGANSYSHKKVDN